jgi:hypothetical protein
MGGQTAVSPSNLLRSNSWWKTHRDRSLVRMFPFTAFTFESFSRHSYPERLTAERGCIFVLFPVLVPPWESNTQLWHCMHQALPTEPPTKHWIRIHSANSMGKPQGDQAMVRKHGKNVIHLILWIHFSMLVILKAVASYIWYHKHTHRYVVSDAKDNSPVS